MQPINLTVLFERGSMSEKSTVIRFLGFMVLRINALKFNLNIACQWRFRANGTLAYDARSSAPSATDQSRSDGDKLPTCRSALRPLPAVG
jgi:hypothetical protein